MTKSEGQHEVESFDLRELSESGLVEIHAFEVAMAAEASPEEPPRPVDNYIAAVRGAPRFIDAQGFLVRDPQGAVAGGAECVLLRTDDNPHLAQLSVAVRAEMRGRRIARRLLSAAVDFAAADGRSLFIGVRSDRVPAGEAFARRIGAVEVSTSAEARLRLAEVDREMVERWIAEGPVRAPGYSLFFVEGPLPEEIIEEVAPLLDVMNDAPGGTSEIADTHTTSAHLREWEEQAAAKGSVKWWVFAKHGASGSLVGLTEVQSNPSRPHVIHQGNTGVMSSHRGHAVGKWMKATMLRRIMDDVPQAVEVRTNNADSNAAMLGINRQLGFEHHVSLKTWHAHLSELRAYLDT